MKILPTLKDIKQIVFQGFGHCTIQGCTCKEYKGSYEKGPCLNCGHRYVDHYR